MIEPLVIGLVLFFSALITAMYLDAKRNAKKFYREQYENYLFSQYNKRLYRWKREAMKWTEEQKKPVKVQFT